MYVYMHTYTWRDSHTYMCIYLYLYVYADVHDYRYIDFFSFIFISWMLITLQYCSGFCHTLT